MCKTVSRRVFLLSKLRYIVDIDTRKLFFNAHIKPHIDYASVVWDGCSDALKKRLNSLHRRAVKLIFPDTTLTTDQKLKEMRIMNNLNITKVCSCTVSLALRPQGTYLTCTHTLPHAIPILGIITLVCLGKEQTYSKQVYPSLVLIYGTTYSDSQILSVIQLLQA